MLRAATATSTSASTSGSALLLLLLLLFLTVLDLSAAVNYEAICGVYSRPTSSWRSRLNSLTEDLFASNYIVGGITTSTKEYPWMVSLRRMTGTRKVSPHFCGGSIVSAKHIVTAAHCVENPSKKSPIVIVYRDQQKRLLVKKIKQIVMHSSYNTYTNDYDIAIMEIEEPFDFDRSEHYLRPICLPKREDTIEHWHLCAVVGWGVLNYGDKYGSNSLLMSDLPIVKKSICQKSYSFLNPITSRMFCAGDYHYGLKGTCQGDSGGPLMCLRDDYQRYQLMGVTSWGLSCGKAKFPSVFSDVAKLSDFIKETTGLD